MVLCTGFIHGFSCGCRGFGGFARVGLCIRFIHGTGLVDLGVTSVSSLTRDFTSRGVILQLNRTPCRWFTDDV